MIYLEATPRGTSYILVLNTNLFKKVAPNLRFDEAVLFNDRQVDKKVIIKAGEQWRNDRPCYAGGRHLRGRHITKLTFFVTKNLLTK